MNNVTGKGDVIFDALPEEMRLKVEYEFMDQFLTLVEVRRDGKTIVHLEYEPDRRFPYSTHRVFCSLNRATTLVAATNGSITFVDDDLRTWRFILINGDWIEQTGRIAFN